MASEKPILYSDEMLKARDEGRKSMTRRVINKKTLKYLKTAIQCQEISDFIGNGMLGKNDEKYILQFAEYQVGDIMLIKEDYHYSIEGQFVTVVYKTEYEKDNRIRKFNTGEIKNYETILKLQKGIQLVWKSKLLMFNFMVRKKDEVVNVRVERLADISTSDIYAEGFTQDVYAKDGHKGWQAHSDCETAFFDTMRACYGEDVFELNPYVWVYTFRRCQ